MKYCLLIICYFLWFISVPRSVPHSCIPAFTVTPKYTQDYFQSFELKHLCHFNHTYSLRRFQLRLGNVRMPLKLKYWIWTLVRWELNNCMFKYSGDLNESCMWFIKNAILSILSIVLTLYFNCGSSNPLVFGSFIYCSASCIMARIGIV